MALQSNGICILCKRKKNILRNRKMETVTIGRHEHILRIHFISIKYVY